VAPPLLTVLLPGLEGTGRLFARFTAAAVPALELQVIAFPPDRRLTYAQLDELVRRQLPADRPFALLGESFSGPLALRIAAAAVKRAKSRPVPSRPGSRMVRSGGAMGRA
jgi:surfactin synthase thioesterase subunit